jgi:hypothetical protein
MWIRNSERLPFDFRSFTTPHKNTFPIHICNDLKHIWHTMEAVIEQGTLWTHLLQFQDCSLINVVADSDDDSDDRHDSKTFGPGNNTAPFHCSVPHRLDIDDDTTIGPLMDSTRASSLPSPMTLLIKCAAKKDYRSRPPPAIDTSLTYMSRDTVDCNNTLENSGRPRAPRNARRQDPHPSPSPRSVMGRRSSSGTFCK